MEVLLAAQRVLARINLDCGGPIGLQICSMASIFAAPVGLLWQTESEKLCSAFSLALDANSLLIRWRVVLQKLRHRFLEILLPLVGLGLGIEGLTCNAAPN